jgi:membrane protein required for colicin V production
MDGTTHAMLFDAAIIVVTLVAVVAGFRAGIVRSAATIIAYLIAMPLAALAMTLLAPLLTSAEAAASVPIALSLSAPWARNALVFFGVFLAIGAGLGALFRSALDDMVGARIGIADRLAGSTLGAIRMGLVAVLIVVIFDYTIPPEREPRFLRTSQLRPLLSLAGQKGLKSLPPETMAFIDRLKRERGI